MKLLLIGLLSFGLLGPAYAGSMFKGRKISSTGMTTSEFHFQGPEAKAIFKALSAPVTKEEEDGVKLEKKSVGNLHCKAAPSLEAYECMILVVGSSN